MNSLRLPLPLLALLLSISLPAACGDPQASGGGSSAVTIVIEPGDSGSALLAAINGAQKSIHMTMYLLSSGAIRDALIARSQAGVEVKIVLNQQFPPGTTVTNQSAYAALQTASVPVVWAPATFTYTHEKCLVIDGNTAWIMTMNASTSGLTSNREYLAIDSTPADVAEAEAQFAADFAGTPYSPMGNLLMSPVTARPGILGLINSARATVDFEAEEVGDTQITAALCSAQARGAKTRGVLADNTLTKTQQTAVDQLKGCGVAVSKLATPYVHAKAIAVDNRAVYVGSINFTMTSLDQNRELGLTTTAAAAVAVVARTIAVDLAAGTSL